MHVKRSKESVLIVRKSSTMLTLSGATLSNDSCLRNSHSPLTINLSRLLTQSAFFQSSASFKSKLLVDKLAVLPRGRRCASLETWRALRRGTFYEVYFPDLIRHTEALTTCLH